MIDIVKNISKRRKDNVEELIGCTSALMSAMKESYNILNEYSNRLYKEKPRTTINIASLQNEIEKINFAFQNLVCLYDRDEQLEILHYEIKNLENAK